MLKFQKRSLIIKMWSQNKIEKVSALKNQINTETALRKKFKPRTAQFIDSPLLSNSLTMKKFTGLKCL